MVSCVIFIFVPVLCTFLLSYCRRVFWDLSLTTDLLNREWLWAADVVQGVREHSSAGSCCCMFVLSKMSVNSTAEPSLYQSSTVRSPLVAACNPVAGLHRMLRWLLPSFFPVPSSFALCILFSNTTEMPTKMLLWMYLLICPYQDGLSDVTARSM